MCLVAVLRQTPPHIFYQRLHSDLVRNSVVVFVMNENHDVDGLWVFELNELVLM